MDSLPTSGPDPQQASAAALLLDSGCFDVVSYAAQCGMDGMSGQQLAIHYLSIGEASGLRPSDAFDPKFYLATNPDVKSTGMSPVLHYLEHGKRENRYPTRARLRADAKYIDESGYFDARIFIRSRSRVSMPGLTPAEDHLLVRDAGPIGDGFDNDLYAHWYGSDTSSHAVSLLHYLDVGLAEHRVATHAELQQRKHVMARRFDARHYLSQLPPDQPVDDPLEHYILHGCRLGYDPEPGFSSDYYLRRYPDLETAGMDLYFHYVAFGVAEGRIGRPDFLDMISRGDQAFDGEKATILVASHEASRTGAPLVGLAIGTHMADTFNVIAYVGRTGSLIEEFRKNCCLLVTGAIDPLDAEYLLQSLKQSHLLGAVLLNSVETNQLCRAALYTDLPSLALIHEFSEYTFPVGRMSNMIETADRVVAPAELIRDSALAELAKTRSGLATNIRVRAQGCMRDLPKDEIVPDMTREEILAFIGATDRKTPIVLGAGFVQIRKGVDLFVQTAAEVRRLYGDDVRFVWVGDGYRPTGDTTYSAWVADSVLRLDLQRTMFFLPLQNSLDLLFEMCSAFFLPSRLDPYPNVAVEALGAGRAVICFEQATGVASLFDGTRKAVGAAVPYLSVVDAAKAITAALRPSAIKQALSNKAFIEREFVFTTYIEALKSELEAARDAQAATLREVARIEACGAFDTGYFSNRAPQSGHAQTRRAIKDYVAQGLKGLMQFNPRPGFHEPTARLAAKQAPALGRPGVPATTHRCVVLDDANPAKPFPGRVALHLHLHYPELADGFLEDLVAARSNADLFVTTTSEEKRLEIAYALRKYRGGRVEATVVPNRGRDIGPFLTEIGRRVRAGQYDIVGHLHAKRSLATDAAMGDRWRTYLMRCLLGGRSGMGGVLAPFARDPGLGLVFAEDRHVVGWTDNRGIADALAARMEPRPVLPEWPVFPIGSMFWARPAALEPLWQLGLETADFPHEPASYDGTVLHAIERMLPSVCIAAGMTWATVYRPGSGW